MSQTHKHDLLKIYSILTVPIFRFVLGPVLYIIVVKHHEFILCFHLLFLTKLTGPCYIKHANTNNTRLNLGYERYPSCNLFTLPIIVPPI